MKRIHTLFYNNTDIKVHIYEEGGIYYMTAEDIGKCRGYSQPGKQLLIFFNRNAKLNNPLYTIKCRNPYSKAGETRFFSEKGICAIGNLLSDNTLKEWITNLCDNIRAGILILNPETVQKRNNPSKQKESSSLNCQRANILVNIAGLCSNDEETENLTNAAMSLLLCDDFEKVREKFLQRYENLISD